MAGTPMYMAPETITHPEAVDARADLYALGAVGYLLLNGQNVFEGATIVEVCGHHLHSKPQSPSARLGSPLPEALEALVLDCVQKDPGQRPQSATEIIRRLDDCDGERPWTAHMAQEWWDEYGHLLSAEREAAENSISEKTIAVAPR